MGYMTPIEKQHALAHYTDVLGQAHEERRQGERRRQEFGRRFQKERRANTPVACPLCGHTQGR